MECDTRFWGPFENVELKQNKYVVVVYPRGGVVAGWSSIHIYLHFETRGLVTIIVIT